MIRITCLGAAGSVTGSCYLVESPGMGKILVDCGLFQGGRQMESRNWEPWGFDPKEIEILFLTHCHIDHCGRIPKLVKDGFQGKIITSPPTAELCEIMLRDAAHIQEMDAEWQTRKNSRQAKGTTGRKIVEGEKQVKIFRENVAVRAKVFPIGGFSAHADQADLIEWVSHFESTPKVFVVHGEITASETLARKISEKLNLIAHVPKWKEHLILKSKDVSVDEPVSEEEGPDVRTTLLNNIIDLENELKALRKKVKTGTLDKEIGEEQIDQLRYIQEELKSVLI